MKVLFIYTNVQGYHQDHYAFGLASIISTVRAKGHEVKVRILQREEDYDACLTEFKQFSPRVVGFTAVSSQFPPVADMARRIKAVSPDTITVCGGVHITLYPECLLETPQLDGAFIGEAEIAFAEFLEKIEKGQEYQDSDNYVYAKNGCLVRNRLKPLLQSLDVLPYPDKEVYPYGDTVKAVGYAPFLFSRGCPFLCTYCSNHSLAKVYGRTHNTPRYRSVESSIREIEETVRRFSVDKIIIVDDIFGLSPQWRRDFCQEYKKRVRIRFQCLLRATIVTEEFIRLLKSAGCYRVSIGIESGNEHVRNQIMERQMSEREIVNAFALAHKYRLQTNAINIIGVPGETEEMLWDTIRLNRRVRPTSSGVNTFYPYKGTKLGDECFASGMVDEELYNDFSRERRETILKYPPEYKKKLMYYYENWERLVYRFDPLHSGITLLKKVYHFRHRLTALTKE